MHEGKCYSADLYNLSYMYIEFTILGG